MAESADFQTILALCDEQKVALDERVVESGLRGRSTNPESDEPTPLLAAIAECGRITRKEPDGSLAGHAIDTSAIDSSDFTAKVFCTIVNTSIDRQHGTDPDTSFYCRGVPNIDTCADTERMFMALATALDRTDETRLDQLRPGCQIVNGDGRALFLREGISQRTGLSLAAFHINGIAYPAGSYVRLRLSHETFQNHSVPEQGISVEDAAAIGHIAFMRLSAFALPLEQRTGSFSPAAMAETVSLSADADPVRLTVAGIGRSATRAMRSQFV